MDVLDFFKFPGRYSQVLSVFIVFQGLYCCQTKPQKTRPGDYFSAGQQQVILAQLIRKTAKRPESTASASEVEAYYQAQAATYHWHFAHSKNGIIYYFISRPAPSLYGKRTGLGGVFELKDGVNIAGFKEVFHTFKMKPEDLLQKGSLLFEKMVNHESLKKFEPGNQGKEEWIEFPDPLNHYDSTAQSWIFGTK